MIALTAEDLRHHLRSAMERAPDARVYGFRVPSASGLPETVEVSGRRFAVVQAMSELALRAALVRAKGASMVVLTPLEDRALALDVRARLARQRLFEIDPWEAARGLFSATRVDGRLRMQPALGRALLRHAAVGYAPVASGVLDEAQAWEGLLRRGLDYGEETLSLDGLMVWACRAPKGLRTLLEGDAGLREAFEGYIERRLGPAAKRWAAVARTAIEAATAPGPFALWAGLLLDVGRAAREHAEAAGDTELAQQVAHLGIHLGYKSAALKGVTPQRAAVYADAARRAWRRCRVEAPDVVEGVLARLDEYLQEQGMASLSVWSEVSRSGWTARLEALARLLTPGSDGEALSKALDRIGAHEEAAARPELLPRLRALSRLSYRLSQQVEPAPDSLGGWARWYVEVGSFEDTLREALVGADVTVTLQAAAREVLDRAAARRRDQQEAFAGVLSQALARGSAGSEVVPVHQVLDEVLSPLVSLGSVLVVVLDGLSWSAARALLRDEALEPWVPWVPARQERHAPMLSTVPSVTRCARASLLTGQQRSGGQSWEREGFEGHARLQKAMGPHGQARLFHKGDLREGSVGMGMKVWKALYDDNTKAVAVVINAIDDQLDGAEQVSFDWTVGSITPLRSLLDMVRGRRFVVLVGDHGHVRDDQSAAPPGVSAPSARWRTDLAGGLVDGEARFTGPMIKALTGEPEVAAAWDERLRYTGRKRGYHGGASLQEIVTPLIVLASPSDSARLPRARLTPLVTSPPDWWRLRQEASPRFEAVAVEAPTQPSGQLTLIAKPPAPQLRVEGWIEALLGSPVYAAQKSAVRAGGLRDDDVRRVLATLAANDDSAHLGTLARALERAEHRVERLLAVLRQLLNVEGYPVLAYNRAEQTLALDRALLGRQFQLGDAP